MADWLRRDPARWWVITLPLAPLAFVLYLAFEWLFLVTGSSPIAALPGARQVAILLRAPLPFLLSLVLLQALAGAASLILYPRIRALAALPAAAIAAFLLLVLFDNFTYTLFRFGLLAAGPTLTVAYATAFAMATIVVCARLAAMAATLLPLRRSVAVAASLAALMVTAGAIHTAAATAARARADRVADRGRPNVLIIGIDGTDADSLPMYGSKRDTMPNLNRRAGQFLLFENAFTNSGSTHGSLTSLLTGRLPFATRVTYPPTVLQGDDARRTLPFILKGLGYTTLQLGMRHYADAEDANVAGFDGANYRWDALPVGGATGHGRGNEVDLLLDTTGERARQRIDHLLLRGAFEDGFAHVVGKAVSPFWRDERRIATLLSFIDRARRPWFVHMHLMDSHCCNYAPDRQWYEGSAQPWEDRRDGVLRETDEKLERVFRALERRGEYDRTIVVIMSDHTLTWTTTGRVPLLIRFPGAEPRGRRGENAQMIDVAPTVLRAIDAPVPAWMDGQPLIQPLPAAAVQPVFGVNHVSAPSLVGEALRLVDVGPPDWGVKTVTMVEGSTVCELDLLTGAFGMSAIPGHTRPAPPPRADEARGRLLARVEAYGFRVTAAAPGRAGGSATAAP